MTCRIAWGFVVVSVAVCGPLGSSLAEEIDKKPIIEQWRKEIVPLKEAYANCQITGRLMYDKNRDGDGVELVSTFRYMSRKALKRLDITYVNFDDPLKLKAKMRHKEHWVIGKTEAYVVMQDGEGEPHRLYKRAAESQVKEYDKLRIMTPYTRFRTENIAGAPVSIPGYGMEGPDFLALEAVKLRSDEHPDADQPHRRKFEAFVASEEGKPGIRFSIVVDERRHWAVSEFSFETPTAHTTYRLHYSEEGADIPKLTRIQTFSIVEGGRSVLAAEERVDSLKFEAPEEKNFTLAAFDIPENAEPELDKSINLEKKN